ncbi:hypothetical protein HOG48_06040 [Candidatus Peregrinibacteria bacterium]|jgi:hypothetical protein|nr:hypothetical protein [Candidatus Peregrinibacteria bacterium]
MPRISGKVISIQEASKLSDKSAQTIRRLVKTNKIKAKRQRTPQGFNYQIYKDSLAKYFGLDLTEKAAKKPLEETVFDLGVEVDKIRSKGKKKNTYVLEDIPIPTEIFDEEPIVKVKKKASDGGITIEKTIDMEEVSSENGEVLEGEVEPEKAENDQTAERFAAILKQMLNQHEEDKTRLFVLLEQFQKRTLVLEERIKRLEAPKRSWWKIW